QHFPTPHDSPLHAVHSHGSDEGSLKLNELTNLVTKLFERIGVLEDDLRKTKKTYSSAFTKLILRVKKLESQIKTGKTRRKARIVHSDDEDIEDDSSKQGRKLSDAEVQEKASTKTEPFIQEVTPTEVIQDQENSEKGSAEVSTAGATKGTASKVPVVSIAEENISTAQKKLDDLKDNHKFRGGLLKIEIDDEKEDLKVYLDIVPRNYAAEDVESLSTKYPIVDWKTCVLTENFMYYQYLRRDDGKKKYPLSQEMLSKMLSKRLEVDHESSQAFELLSTNGVSTASTYLVLSELVNTARRKINTADGQSC
ncbi:hypothetical protein Tco_0920336, partial [Tanacetum coccineum]